MPPTNYLRRSPQKSARAPAANPPIPRSPANSLTRPLVSPHAGTLRSPRPAPARREARPAATEIPRPLLCKCRSSPPLGCTSATIAGLTGPPVPSSRIPPAQQLLREMLASCPLLPFLPRGDRTPPVAAIHARKSISLVGK